MFSTTSKTLEPVEEKPPKNNEPSVNSLYALARLYVVQGKDKEGDVILSGIVRDHPTYTPAYSDLAKLRIKHGRYSDAVALLEAGLEYGANDPVLHNNLGLSLLLNGEPERGLKSFTNAKQLEPTKSKYQANIALAYGLMGNIQQSVETYRTIMSEEDTMHNIRVIQTMRDPEAAQAILTEELADVVVEDKPVDASILDAPEPKAGDETSSAAIIEDLQAVVGEENKSVII